MKNVTKRGLALFLTLVMCLGMLNVTAFAAEVDGHTHNSIACTTCDGTGKVTDISACPTCGGEIEMSTCEKCKGDGWLGRYEVDWASPCPVNGEACDSCDQCVMGYELKLVTWDCDACGGAGQVSAVTVETCSKCDGDGWLGRYTIDWNTPCPVNGEACNGCSQCSMGYAKKLVTWDCDACDGWGTTVTASGDACETCGGHGQVKESYECTTCEGTGEVDCTGDFDDGKLTKNNDGTGTMTYTCATCKSSYTEELTHEEVVAVLDNEGHVEPAEDVEIISATCAQEGSKTYTCAVEGCEVVVAEAIPTKEHNIQKNICTECGAMSFRMFGTRMAYAYGWDKLGSEAYNCKALIRGSKLTMENLGFDTSDGYWGEFVTNRTTNKVWQCVGFVPAQYEYAWERLPELAFTNSTNVGCFQSGDLATAQQYVTNNGGVLYGEVPTDTAFIGRSGIAAVWYVADINVEIGEYGDLSIAPVEVPALRENSTGIEVHCNLDTLSYNHSTGAYNVDLVITIGADAPDNAHVNLVPGIKEAADKINTGLGANDTFQPGDELQINVTIDNQSGRQYTYDRNSGLIATNPDLSVNGDAGEGFDGFRIPHSTNAEFAFIARRIFNEPLQKLGLNENDLSDEAVGAALRTLGYGSENDSNEEITRTYLVNYYLDYTNAVRKVANKRPVASFEDLTMWEIMVFTTGDTGTAVFEECPAVVEALYFYYFGHVLTFNDVSFYQQMVNYTGHVSEMESAVPALLRDETYQISVKLAGEEVPNGFQNTQFGFRIEFDLTYTPDTPNNPGNPTSGTTSRTVKKVWVGDGDIDRPASVTVQLYRDGAAYDTVTLSEANNWTYAWSSLNDSYTWTIGEINVPEGYTSTVSQDGTTVTVTNTYGEPEIPDEPPPLTDIPDEEPPLANVPEEPEVEVPDEDVPLSDVPETGDNSTKWFGAALLSAFGLAILSLFDRKKRNEG